MINPLIRFPKGGGGSWLGNLMWHLENAQWEVPGCQSIFDGEPRGTLIFRHWVEFDPEPIIIDPTYANNLLFSTDQKFNQYLNYCTKQRYSFYNIGQLPLADQVLDLSNSAKFLMTDPYIDQYYCHNIDLDYAWIFQNPELLMEYVYKLLDTYNISYTANNDYIYSSIKKYQSTCLNPQDVLGNTESIVWLGWCHSVGLIENINITGQIIQQEDIKSIAEILKPTVSRARQLAEENLFYWTYEYTT